MKKLEEIITRNNDEVRIYLENVPIAQFRNDVRKLIAALKGQESIRHYIDLRLLDNNWIIAKIQAENEHQLKKWGTQTHTAFQWLTFTTEELGETANAISEYEYRDGTKERVVHEAIQVATLALKIAEMFERI